MASRLQIIIPARTSKTVTFDVSGFEDMSSYQFIMTVKRAVNITTVLFTVEGVVDGTYLIFNISADDTDLPAGTTLKYDVVGIKDDLRIPVCTDDMIIVLWPSSLEPAV